MTGKGMGTDKGILRIPLTSPSTCLRGERIKPQFPPLELMPILVTERHSIFLHNMGDNIFSVLVGIKQDGVSRFQIDTKKIMEVIGDIHDEAGSVN